MKIGERPVGKKTGSGEWEGVRKGNEEGMKMTKIHYMHM